MRALRYSIWLFFRYDGRLGRLAYLLGIISASVILGGILVNFEDPLPERPEEWTPLTITVAIFVAWTYTALLVKRLRDIDLHWTWALLLAVPLIQILVLFGFAIPKRGGPPPPIDQTA